MQELNGYIKLFRKLIRWGWYQDNVVKGLFIHCLLCASYKDFEWMGQKLKAGQFITGRKKLAKELGFSEQQIRTAIKKLESTGEITSTTTNKYSVITVVNWEDYQVDVDESDQESNFPITNKQPTKSAVFCEQIINKEKNNENSTKFLTNKKNQKTPLNRDFEGFDDDISTESATNKQPTSNQQATNKQPHIKNNKNIKNIKKRENTRTRVAPSIQSIIVFAKESLIETTVANKFFAYYDRLGWKTTHGTDISGCWQDKLVEWNQNEIKKKDRKEKRSFAAYDKKLIEEKINQN